MRNWLAIALAVGLTTAACSRAEGAGFTAAGAEAGALEEHGPASFWWNALEADRAAMVWFGPPYLDVQSGAAMRPWVLTCYLPGDNPYVWFQATVPLHSSLPIGFSSGAIELELFPIEGLTWAEVSQPDQLVYLARGLMGS